jgi:hypothetical protein
MNYEIRKDGRHFTLNGKKTKLRMRTSFKFMGWLMEGKEGKARRWLERVKKQGFHGIRVFGETHLWGPPFFGLPPVNHPFNLNSGVGSGFKLTPKHKQVLRRFVELLQEYDLVSEYSVLATLKGTWNQDPRVANGHDVVGWNSHALRTVSEEFLKIRDQLGATNCLFETFNEFDAHAVSIPRGELHNEARRWKVRDLPGSLIGVSRGGRWDFDYDVGDGARQFSHCNIHSPRRAKWFEIADDLQRVRGVVGEHPIYLNENMHYMTQAEWDEWIPKVPKWANLSTTDWVRIQQQWNYAYNADVSYCVHDFIGMQTDPDAEWSPLEHAHAEQFGDGGPPPPPPPPPPDKLTSGPIKVELSAPDPLGRLTFTSVFPKGLFPLLLEGGTEDDAKPVAGTHGGEAIDENKGVLRCKYTIDLGKEYDLSRFLVFHGKNAGDVMEMDTYVYDQYGNMLVARSDHKETLSDYDAWREYNVPARTSQLAVHLVARTNGRSLGDSSIVGYSGEVFSMPHYGLRIQGRLPDGVGNGGGGGGVDPAKEKYLTLERAATLYQESNHRQQSMIWAGCRDLLYASDHCKLAVETILKSSPAELGDLGVKGSDLYSEMDRMRDKLLTEHQEHPGRSMVRKEVWIELNERYSAHEDRADELRHLAQQDPIREQHPYDSLKGWCQARNN